MKKNTDSTWAPRRLHLIAVSAFLFSAFAIASYYVISPPTARGVSSGIVISQVYGGGGNAGATFKNDFVELFNRGNSAINVSGWSVQYASTAGTSWQVTNLSGSIAPGRYYLVQEAAGTNGTTSLPTPDAIGGINMSATGGKVALLNTTTPLTGSGCPLGASLIDFVGYDGANCFEGAAAPSLTNTTAALRGGNGCNDTDNNSSDFTAGAPNPRNSSSPAQSCGGSTNPSGVGAANPSTVLAGTSTLLTVAVTPGTNPASTGITVNADLTSIGGSGTQQFFDDGTHGDATAGDNTFSFQATVSSGASAGAKNLPASIADAQSRTGSATISLTVTVPSTNPSGTGAANPNALMAGGSTLLTVNVTRGSNPPSTGVAVTADLSSIGGSGFQQFFDDGSHGDAVAGDNVFSFQATVSIATAPGGKGLPVSITDAQARSGSTTISLTVQTQTVPPGTIVISQAYGGGGNSGSTYTNDFIELYNRGTSTVNLAGWSVQYNSATLTGTWQVTNLSGTIAPGHYFLVQESQGAGGTTSLPTPDATGAILMSGTAAKVAVVSTTLPLSGCPTGPSIIDLVGYGSTANCFETSPTPTLSNTTAAIRRGNGCVDTNNNSADLFIGGPIPRNSASPANSCGGDPNNPSGLGDSFPTSLDPSSNVLLTVTVTPATTPPSTSIAVVGDLTSIGGPASQQFFDNGTHGDVTPGDNVFSFLATVDAHATTGAKSILTTITDAQLRSATAPMTLTVQSPTCGVERWSVKTGTDPDASLVDLNNPTPTTIAFLRSFAAPADPPGPPLNARVAPAETTVWVVNATMTLYKKETDVDYHIVIQDLAGNTMVTEIPCPCCVGAGSPFAAGVANAREEFDAKLTATAFFQSVSLPVQITGVGFFDFIHGQTGVAPNGIELHPILDIKFLASTSTSLTSSVNPSSGGQSVTFTAAVTSTGIIAPSGFVTFRDGADVLGTGFLNAFGMATFTTSSLSIGSHSITAEYDGDANSGGSLGALTQTVLNNPPVARCKNVTVSADSSCTAGGPSTTIDDGSSDPDGDAITFTQTPAAPYPLGSTTVTLTVTDSRGGSSSCTGVVTVNDTSPPSATCPAGTTASADANCQAAVPSVVGGVTASDNCTPASSLTITQNPVAGTLVGVGVTTITVTVKDAANNSATCTTTFTVTDSSPPTITCPANILRNNDPNQCSAVVTFQPAVGDNCGGVSTNCAPPSSSVFLVGTTNVTCTSSDGAHNQSSCSFTVTVRDAQPPVIECPGNIVTTNAPGQCSANVSVGTATATDNCSIASIVGVRSDALALSAPYPVGITTIVWTATDAAGNHASCAQTVTVNDTEAPVINGGTANPSTLWPPNHNMVDVTISYTVTDNCTPSANVVCDLTVSSNERPVPLGNPHSSDVWQVIDAHHVQLRSERDGNGSGRVYTVTISCTDSSGNTATKTVAVTVPHNQ